MPLGGVKAALAGASALTSPLAADQDFTVAQKVGYLGGTENDTLVGTIDVLAPLVTIAIVSGNTSNAFRVENFNLLVNNVNVLTSGTVFTLGMEATGVGTTAFTVTVTVTDIWEPADDANCEVWGLAEGSASLVLTASNDITQATDKSGNANHFTVPPSMTAPTFQSSVWNGRGMAQFDGVTDRLGGGTFSLGLGNPTTGGMVVNLPSPISANGQIASYLNFNGLISTRLTGTAIGLYGGTVNQFRTGVSSAPVNHILVWEDDGTSSGINLWLDGVQVVTNGASTNPETTAQTGVVMCLGGQFAGATDVACKIGEWCFFSRVDRDDLTLKLINHLSRWQSLLPGGEQSENDPPTIAPQSFEHFTTATSGQQFYTVIASDPNADGLTYSFVSGNSDGKYAINSTTGSITAATSTWTAGSRTLLVRVTDTGALTAEANVSVTVSVPPTLPAGIYASPDGNDTTGTGTVANPYRTLNKVKTVLRTQPAGTAGYLRGGEYILSATETFDSNDANRSFFAAPGETAIVSGGSNQSATLEQLGSSNYWWFTSPSGLRHHMVEVTPSGGTPKALQEVFWMPSGAATSDYPGDDIAQYKAGWIRFNRAATQSAVRGKILAANWSVLNTIGVTTGQIWGVYCAGGDKNAIQYFWYDRSLTGIHSPDEVSFGSQFAGAPISTNTRPITNGCRGRFHNWPTWLLASDWVTDAYSYAASCGTLAYDGQSTTFVAGEKINGQTSGATGYVMVDVDAGATGTLYLVQTTGTFQDNENLRSGVTVRAVANGTMTSKGNRIVVKSTDSLTGARCAVGTLNRLVAITGNNITIGGDGKGFSFRNTLHMPADGTGGNFSEGIHSTGLNTTIRGNTFVGVGLPFVCTAAGWKVINNEIAYCDSIGTVGAGTSSSEVGHNYAHDQTGPLYGAHSSLTVGGGSGCRIHHNKFERMKQTAGRQGGSSSGVIWEYNVFYKVQKFSADSSNGWYSSGQVSACQFRHNWFQGGEGLDSEFNTGAISAAANWRAQSQLRAIYLDDGARFWTVRGNVVVWVPADGGAMGRCPHMAAHSRPDGPNVKTPSGDILVEGNLFVHRNNGWPTTASNLDRNRMVEVQSDKFDINGDGIAEDSIVQNVTVRGNIFINVGTARTGYIKKEGSGTATPGTILCSYNVNKDNGVTATNAGAFASTNDIFNPSYALIRNANNAGDALFTINPLLADGTAQNLKLARGSGGIGWVEIEFAEMQKAGLLP